MGNLCPGQQQTNARHDRRGDETRLPVLRTCLHTEPAHMPFTPHHARASGALPLTMFRARRVSRSQKACIAMTAPPASNRRCCAAKAPTAYYHAPLTIVRCWLPCTAYDNAPLTTMHRLLSCTAYYHAPLTTMPRRLPCTAHCHAPLTTMHAPLATMRRLPPCAAYYHDRASSA